MGLQSFDRFVCQGHWLEGVSPMAEICKAVKATGVYNYQQARIPLIIKGSLKSNIAVCYFIKNVTSSAYSRIWPKKRN